ncbi:porin family protein [Roseibium sp. CAU 1637]|uniref:Porin family protein n=1 Tax=Roseibium limicola TaxID=2816037 RepID=A0A939EJM9_9HYPH|nr:outer membrane protein [Roseibium limicola]MBO0343814.1 porin family protein [Roseibium limicola]
MKRLALVGMTALVSGLSAQALAADLPYASDPAPTTYSDPVAAARFDWTGAYVGGNVGWGWGNFENSGAADTEANGVQGGVHAGYNYMITPNFLAGVEADFQLSDLSDTGTLGGVTAETSSDWNASIRGRLGFTFDRFLVYGAGGLAVADQSLKVGGSSDDATAIGWTLGGGVEGAVTNNITARLEYVHQNFGSEDFNISGTQYQSELDDNIVRFGMSYKF